LRRRLAKVGRAQRHWRLAAPWNRWLPTRFYPCPGKLEHIMLDSLESDRSALSEADPSKRRCFLRKTSPCYGCFDQCLIPAFLGWTIKPRPVLLGFLGSWIFR